MRKNKWSYLEQRYFHLVVVLNAVLKDKQKLVILAQKSERIIVRVYLLF